MSKRQYYVCIVCHGIGKISDGWFDSGLLGFVFSLVIGRAERVCKVCEGTGRLGVPE